METGFIKLHRKILEWEWYTNGNIFMLFVHLLFKVNYKDKQWGGITIKRGQIITSSLKLSEELKLTRQQIRTALKKLESTRRNNHKINQQIYCHNSSKI